MLHIIMFLVTYVKGSVNKFLHKYTLNINRLNLIKIIIKKKNIRISPIFLTLHVSQLKSKFSHLNILFNKD